MNFIVMLFVMTVFSAGVFAMMPGAFPLTHRLDENRRFGMAFLRKALAERAAAAGKGVSRMRNAKKKESICKELYTALSVLRNHASAGEGGGSEAGGTVCVTTDYILEQFAQAEGDLGKYCAGALRLLRTGRRAEAVEYFTAAADVELARDFIMLVLDWDAVPPHKLKKTVGAFQNALKETRTTQIIRRNEALSDLVYLPVVACVLVIFVNFIYVAYFAEQRALLAELFY